MAYVLDPVVVGTVIRRQKYGTLANAASKNSTWLSNWRDLPYVEAVCSYVSDHGAQETASGCQRLCFAVAMMSGPCKPAINGVCCCSCWRIDRSVESPTAAANLGTLETPPNTAHWWDRQTLPIEAVLVPRRPPSWLSMFRCPFGLCSLRYQFLHFTHHHNHITKNIVRTKLHSLAAFDRIWKAQGP